LHSVVTSMSVVMYGLTAASEKVARKKTDETSVEVQDKVIVTDSR
jgi:hypothetical protein